MSAFIYMMINPRRTVIYTGVTTKFLKRVWQHKQRTVGFTAKYNATWLAYFEELDGPNSAIIREKQIKGWSRTRKLALVKEMNPAMIDLSPDWYDDPESAVSRDSSLRSE